jgi:lipopolysaccharide export system protein LptC
MKPVIAGITLEMETILQSIGRYTRFVYSTKLALALLAAILTAMILFYPVFKHDSNSVRIAFTSIEKKSPGSPTQMIGAKFHGLDKSNQPYNITASTATQIDDNTLGLDKVTGDIALNSGAWLAMSSNSGVFRMKEKLLDLMGSIEMFNEGGYEFRTELMHVNVGNKTAMTREEITGQGPLGTLKAYGGASIDGTSQAITFIGPVFVTMYPQQAEAGQPQGKIQ